MQIPASDLELALELVNERPGEPLSAYDVASKAYRRSSLKQYENAAALFYLAALRAAESGDKPDQSPNHLVRAGFALNRVGRIAEAEALLWDATRFDWVGAGLANDKDIVEGAFTHLLCNAYQAAPESFADLFRQAVERCAELGLTYPHIYPDQEKLLPIALELQEWNIAQRIVDCMWARRPISRPARALLKKAEEVLAAQR